MKPTLTILLLFDLFSVNDPRAYYIFNLFSVNDTRAYYITKCLPYLT